MSLLEEIPEETLSESYKTISKGLSAELIVKNELKEMEDKLKDDIVSSNQFYKKNGNPDYGKVKMTLLKMAIEIVENGAENKLERDLEILEGYMADIRSERISPAAVKGYARKVQFLKSTKEEAKDAAAHLKSEMNGDVVEALTLIAKNEVAIEKERIDAESGKGKKEGKDTAPILSLVSEIKEKLGKR